RQGIMASQFAFEERINGVAEKKRTPLIVGRQQVGEESLGSVIGAETVESGAALEVDIRARDQRRPGGVRGRVVEGLRPQYIAGRRHEGVHELLTTGGL